MDHDAHGANVATFEPHPPNFLRMCESMCLNDWLRDSVDSAESDKKNACLMGSYDSPLLSKHITIFPYGVAEEDKDLYFVPNSNNPGQGQVMQSVSDSHATTLRCVTLDGMVDALGWTSGPIDILKVDMEGAEMGVFLGAQELLKSHRVQNVFMEGNVRDASEIEKFETLVKLFLDSDYYLYKIGGYSGPESTTDVPKQDKKLYQKSCDEVHIRTHCSATSGGR